MLPYATPAVCAQLDPYEEREHDTLRSTARQQLGSPAQAGARIALAICEVEAEGVAATPLPSRQPGPSFQV
jgi:hypothetical protein